MPLGRDALGVGRARVPGELGHPGPLGPAGKRPALLHGRGDEPGDASHVGDRGVVGRRGVVKRSEERVGMVRDDVEVDGASEDRAPEAHGRDATAARRVSVGGGSRGHHERLRADRLHRSIAGVEEAPEAVRALRVEPAVAPGPLRREVVADVRLVPHLPRVDPRQVPVVPGVPRGRSPCERLEGGDVGAPGRDGRIRRAMRPLGPAGRTGEREDHREPASVSRADAQVRVLPVVRGVGGVHLLPGTCRGDGSPREKDSNDIGALEPGGPAHPRRTQVLRRPGWKAGDPERTGRPLRIRPLEGEVDEAQAHCPRARAPRIPLRPGESPPG